MSSEHVRAMRIRQHNVAWLRKHTIIHTCTHAHVLAPHGRTRVRKSAYYSTHTPLNG